MKHGSRIIMIGSCVGERILTPGMAPYAATKGAIKMFCQGLAREIGDKGITVNNVQPGPIDTDLNPAAGDWAAPKGGHCAGPLWNLLKKLPRWWRLWLVRSHRTSPARI